MTERQLLKPVKYTGVFMILITLIGLLLLSNTLAKGGFEDSFKYFVAIVSVFHLSVGLGMLSEKKWGYYSMKIYLYLMLLGVPIGTMLSLKALQYLRKHKIKRYYL